MSRRGQAGIEPDSNELCICGHTRDQHRLGGQWCYQCDCWDFKPAPKEIQGSVSKQFGSTTHSEIMHAFEAESRQHTFVEQMPNGEHRKTYQLRLSLEELLTVLDSLASVGGKKPSWTLESRQLRAKILGTLGLFEGS